MARRKNIRFKEAAKDIRILKREAKYQEIFDKYGVIVYREVVPRKYKKAHIKKLFSEGRYEDIYRLYGRTEYEKLLYKIMGEEVRQETGKRKGKMELALINNQGRLTLHQITHRIIPKILAFFMSFGLELGVISDIIIEAEKDANQIEYHEKIKAYDERIKEYVSEINEMDLDDFQIIMKVVDDMWKTIKGYGEPTIDATGYFRLDMMEDGVGVCRNMADDITYKLNLINPEYNARNLIVDLDTSGFQEHGLEMANIERKFVEYGIEQDSEESRDENLLLNRIKKAFGNHMVTIVDVPGKNITLVIDPTNPQIGVFVDGKIHMFFNKTGEGIKITPLGQIVGEGTLESIEVLQKQLLSFLPTEYSLEELEEMYGTDAQNKALKIVREKSKMDRAAEWRESYAVKDRRSQELEGCTGTQIVQKTLYQENLGITDTGSSTTSGEENEWEIE